MGEASGRVGAYGFELSGLAEAGALLGPVPAGSPSMTVTREDLGPSRSAPRNRIGADDAQLRLQGDGLLLVQREPLKATFDLPGPVGDAELAHPYLVPACAIAGHWHGYHPFHAGGYIAGGGVWGVLGDRGSGKSTLLAWLALQGVPIVADDMLVVADDVVHSGPRAIDLRPDAAEALAVGDPMGVVGSRERWRVGLPALPEPAPLLGWIALEWGERTTLEHVPPSGRVARVLRQRTLRSSALPPPVDVLTKSLFVLRRPSGWAALPEAGLAALSLPQRAELHGLT